MRFTSQRRDRDRKTRGNQANRQDHRVVPDIDPPRSIGSALGGVAHQRSIRIATRLPADLRQRFLGRKIVLSCGSDYCCPATVKNSHVDVAQEAGSGFGVRLSSGLQEQTAGLQVRIAWA